MMVGVLHPVSQVLSMSAWETFQKKLSKLAETALPTKRQLSGFEVRLVDVTAALFAGFYVYSSGFGMAAPEIHRGVYFGMTMILGFMLYRFRTTSPANRISKVDYVLVALTISCVGYFIYEYPKMAYRAGAYTRTDVIVGIIATILALELTRRVLGNILPVLAILALIYVYFGPYMPEFLLHKGFSITRISGYLFSTLDGLLGVVVNTYATYVIMFIIFGSFMEKSGVGKFLIDLPYSLAGRLVGGPAKVSVVASALFGSVSGSAVANTVATGTFTIPLMKQGGYKPHIAGAIEPAASTGGQFLPPVMGAGAFIMAEITGVSYLTIVKLAVIPALIYFFSVFVMVHFEAKKHNLKGLSKEDLPDPFRTLMSGWYLALPLFVLIGFLIKGYSPNMCAFWAIITCIVVSWVKKETRMGPRQIYDALSQAGKSSLIVGAAAGTIGIIIGGVTLTGLGFSFSDMILSLSGESLPFTIVLAGIAAFILGCGVPVTASYVILAVLAAPALIELQFPLVGAHLTLHWYSQLSNVTPPVCLCAYAAAGIANSDPFKTGIHSLKFSIFLVLMPFLFAYTPILLDPQWTFLQTLQSVIFVCLGAVTFGAFLQGYFYTHNKIADYLLLAIATFCLLIFNLPANFIGGVLAVMVWFWQKKRTAA
ncbi:MAG: TRAP transporter permease [Candidatus Vecturithrix sp.]|jgi:TRAP transporter 4TM/12TM fusion protein|nr:TRAP transporter permease [Candidatus Vecturithrix sp.]